MKNSLTTESDYLNALFKTAQYLATLITYQDFWVCIKELIKEYYNVDLFYFYECGYDGKIFKLQKNFSNNQFSEKIFEQIKELLTQVMDSGFIASELINIPESYAIVLLPITKIKKIMGIIVIGYQRNELLPKYLLNIYLSLARLLSTTIDNLYMIEELKNSEEGYRNLFESNLDGIVHVDMEGNFRDCNRAFLNMVGYTMGEIKALTFQQLTPQRWIKEDELVINQIMEKGYCDEYEKEFIKKDGNLFPVSLKAWLRKDEKGEIVGMWGIVRDITERKKAEEALKESETFNRLLVDTLPIGLALCHMDGSYIDVNPAYAKILGRSIEETLKLTYWDITPKKYNKQELAQLESMEKTGHYGPYEKEYIHRDGHLIPVRLSGLIIEKEGEQSIWSSVEDITERKKVEENMRILMKDLKRSNTELEEFAYVASHDLQEPLRMVASFTQLLERHYKDKLDDDANDFINFIVGGTTRMKSLINDLLIFSRVGTRAKLFKVTDMNNVLENALANVKQSIKDTNVTITNDPLPVIIADDSQMMQLFQNLISNALKFHGEEDPHIHVSGEVKEEEWIFSVRDNGIGIDSKNFDRIFVIFQRLHKRDEYGGTGIGLAVCKKIIQRHGGKIWVESEIGKGSTFYFTIQKKK